MMLENPTAVISCAKATMRRIRCQPDGPSVARAAAVAQGAYDTGFVGAQRRRRRRSRSLAQGLPSVKFPC